MKSLLSLLACTLLLALTADGQRRGTSEFFPILDNGCWGFIDKSGKVIIEPQFDAAWSSDEGLEAVLVGEKWGT